MNPQSSAVSSTEDYYDLGSFHRPVSTQSDSAQIWFDRGLIWSYAFNHEEAVTCFEHAIANDSSCAMAYWGLAYSLGPNYNKQWESFDEKDLDATVSRVCEVAAQAGSYASTSSPVEQAIIRALQVRYPGNSAPPRFSLWNQAYAHAMGLVYKQFQDDLDVAALYADALMNLTPWKLWDLQSGEPALGAHTIEVKDILDRSFAKNGGLSHPALLHLYIHLMEMSSTPEIALPTADHLRGLVPDSGHLNHMPTHLDILCGDYQRAIASNSDAIQADEKFVARSGPLNFYALYRCHNYHFRIYAAMFAGQSKVALDTVAQLEASIPESLLSIESPPMANWLEAFLSVRLHVLIRFGLWEDILQLKLPQNRELYSVTTAMMHYAKGVALAATRKIKEAEKEQELFYSALQLVPSSRTQFNNKCIDLLAIAKELLAGELEYRRGNIDLAFDYLLRSIALSDALPYDEPWGWMQPTRHAYGALLLEQGYVEKAAEIYSSDLGIDNTLPRAIQHPNNVWALHGYHECLVKLGRTSDVVEQRLILGLAIADVPIKSSCFCRLSTDELKVVEDSKT
ncbi:hypothetical protein B7494_g8486 [Chlorociboria aeruginascens]|nr:hypothetical protein B7494_g8486 [Chlorociboria aeruginascens]